MWSQKPPETVSAVIIPGGAHLQNPVTLGYATALEALEILLYENPCANACVCVCVCDVGHNIQRIILGNPP